MLIRLILVLVGGSQQNMQSIIKIAQIISTTAGKWTVKLLNRQQQIQPLGMQGFRYVPMQNQNVVVFEFLNREQQLLGISDNPTKSLGNLQQGEVAVGNLETESSITFKQDGSVIITLKKTNTTINMNSDGVVSINNATSINLDGSLPLTLFGGLETALADYAASMATSLATGANSAGTVAFAVPPPTSIDISSAKCLKVNGA